MRGAVIAAFLSASLLTALPAGAGASCCNFLSPSAILFSRDGRFGYVIDYAGSAIIRRDPTSGALSDVDGSALNGEAATMTADGAFLYVSEYGRIKAARRDGDTGLLTPGAVVTTPDGGDVKALAASPDGRNLYASEQAGAPILIYARDPSSGALSFSGTAPEPPAATRPSHPESMAVTGDGRFLYAADYGAVYGYAREPASDALTPQSATDTSASAGHPRPTLLAAPDGTRLYVGDNPYVVLARDSSSGATSVLGTYDLTANGVTGSTALAPDGRDLYAAGSDALSHVAVAGDALQVRRTYRNYDGATRGLRGAHTVAVSPDGRQVYVATGAENNSEPHVVIFDRNTATGDVSFQGTFRHRGSGIAGPAPQLTFTIDHGAEFTRDRHVTLTFADPYFGVELSNDGGFRPATRLGRVEGPPRSYPWTLASSGPERLAKTVYARTTGPFPAATRDDIVLDERPPEVVSASLVAGAIGARATSTRAGRGVRVVARDRISGVGQVQIAPRRGHPGRWRHYRARALYIAPNGAGLRVRVRDRAGNVSRWRGVAGPARKRGRR